MIPLEEVSLLVTSHIARGRSNLSYHVVGKLDAYPLAVLFIENMDTSSVT